MNKFYKLICMMCIVFILSSLINIKAYAAKIGETENNPYIISGATTVINNVDKFPVYVKVNDSSGNGTYNITYDKKEKTLTLSKYSSDKIVFYNREFESKSYMQADVIPKLSTSEPVYKGATQLSITSIEKTRSGNNSILGFVSFNSKNPKHALCVSGDPSVELILTSKDENGNEIDNVGIIKDVKHTMNGNGMTAEYYYGTSKQSVDMQYGVTEQLAMRSTTGYFVLSSGGKAKDVYLSVSKNSFGNQAVTHCYYDANGDRTRELYLIIGENGQTSAATKVYYGVRNDADIDIVYKINGEIEEDESAGWIETAITKLLLGLGEVFMYFVRLFLGGDMTMDGIIFNKYKDTVLDLGAILGNGDFAEGFLGNSDVVSIINYVFYAFRNLAIIIYIIILLYMGIKVVLSVGTSKQSKSLKYLEGWVISVVILFYAPNFFHYITDISNAIVSYIGKKADIIPTYSEYNLVILLDDDALLGEDSDTKKRVEGIVNAISKREDSIKEKEEELNKYIEKKNQILNVTIPNFHSAIDYSIRGSYAGTGASNEQIEKEVAKYNLTSDFREIANYIESNIDAINDKTSREYNKYLKMTEKFRKKYSMIAPNLIQNIQNVYEDYLTMQGEINKIEEEINVLKSFLETDENGNIIFDKDGNAKYIETQDIVTMLRIKAGTTGRFVYAVAWLVLMFQMFILLAMYYKRIIVVIILIMIFPVIMVSYAIDKAGDGKAQTLESWFKELTVNVLVQVIHAFVYVVIIKTGMDIYADDPNNWFFLLMAMLLIFPVERIMRGVLGMQSSTIGELKAGSLVGKAMAGVAVAKMGANAVKGGINITKSGANLVKDIKKDGLSKTISNKRAAIVKKWNDDKKAAKAAADAKTRRAQKRADDRRNLREDKMEERKKRMQTAKGLRKARLKAANIASSIRNGAYHVGNAGRKIAGVARKAKASGVYRAAKGATNFAYRNGRRMVGVMSGITTGLTTQGGAAASIQAALQTGRAVGGFKNQQIKPSAKPTNTSANNGQNATTQTATGSSTHASSNSGGGFKGAYKKVKNGIIQRDSGGGKRTIKTAKNISKNRKINTQVNYTTNDSGGHGNSDDNGGTNS